MGRLSLLLPALVVVGCTSAPEPVVVGEKWMVVGLEYGSAAEVAAILEDYRPVLICFRHSADPAENEALAREAELQERAAVPKVVPQAATNSLLLIGTSEQLSRALDLIWRLDVRPEPAYPDAEDEPERR